MNWKEIVTSALTGEGDLNSALGTAVTVDPEELFLLLRNLPEEKDHAPHIAMFLNKLGILYWDAQMPFLAEEAFKEALRRYQCLAGQNPDFYVHEIAATQNNLGTLYSQRGEFLQAEKAFSKALKIKRELAKKDPESYAPDLALTLNNVGALSLDRGRFLEAEKFFTEALKIKRDLAKKDPLTHLPDVAMILNNFGTMYCQTGKFQKSEKAYNESLEIKRALAEKNPEYMPQVAMTLNNVGLLYKETRKFSEAERAYKEALKIRGDLAEKNPEYMPQVAMTLNNVGLLYRDTQRFSEAERAFLEALEKYKAVAIYLKAYNFQIAVTLNNVGALYRIIGKFFEAEKAFTEALEKCKELARENPEAYTPHVALTLNNLGLFYWDTKRFDKAERVHKEALEKYKALEKENPEAYTPHVALTLSNLGATYLGRKEFSEAERIYKEALEKYGELADQNREGYTFHVAGLLNNLGLIYKDTQKFSEAEKVLNEALEEYKRGASWFYAANTAYHLSQMKGREILETSRKLLELGVLFSKEEKYTYAQKGEKEHIYWGLLEQGVSPFSVLEALRDPEGLSLRWDQILSQKELERAQEDVEFQKMVVEDVLKKPIPAIKTIKLPEDLLFMYIQKVRDSIFFFIVNSDGVEKFKGERKFFTTGIKLLYLLRFQLRAAGKPRLSTYVKKFEELTREWYETLPQELRELIKEKNEIVFSPDYYCSFFPLEALHVDGNPLCIEKTVVRAASLHQFSKIVERKPSLDSSLVVGNPWPECDEKKLIYSVPSDSDSFRISFLQGAQEEAEALKRRLPIPTVLLGQEATGEKFLSEVSRHSLIHFAGHGSMGRILFLSGPLRGFPPPFEPKEFSSLRKAERSDSRRVNMMEEWHPVTDLDLFEINLTEGAVIFLNACEAGQHKYAGGGYYQGLPAVFLKNGAHSVVSSLVPLFDEPSKEFALHFYENLFHTHSVANALKEARVWIKNTYKAQIYWAPYIHYGPPL